MAVVVVLAVVVLVARPWASDGSPAVHAGPAVVSGAPAGWVQVFADDFDGTSLDRSVWQPDRSGDKAGEPFNPVIEDGWFNPDDVSVSHGSLLLTVGGDGRTIHGRSYGHSSGMVQSNAAIPLTPTRYLEARIRFPECSGCWPAFWMVPVDRWPPEIDIAEFLETSSKTRPSFNYFDANEKETGGHEYGDAAVDYRDEFHTYGALWEGDRIVPYIDGKPYPAVEATANVTSIPMMIILNLSVRGGYDTRPGEQMQVDWVRVWAPPAPSS